LTQIEGLEHFSSTVNETRIHGDVHARWVEAYDGLNGFAIGTGRPPSNMDVHDRKHSGDLREEIIPLYYQRDRDGLPRAWIKRMKRTIRSLGWRFNADRAVMDYTFKCYVPTAGGILSDMSLCG
jgi:starch phosphorylase